MTLREVKCLVREMEFTEELEFEVRQIEPVEPHQKGVNKHMYPYGVYKGQPSNCSLKCNSLNYWGEDPGRDGEVKERGNNNLLESRSPVLKWSALIQR